MKTIHTVVPIVAFIVVAIAAGALAEDCSSQFSAEQRKIYESLSTANRQILDTQIKDRNGQPASCDFQRGLLDLLANFTPDKRDAGFKQIVDKMLIRTP